MPASKIDFRNKLWLGQVVGSFKVIEFDGRRMNSHHPMWVCECLNCGARSSREAISIHPNSTCKNCVGMPKGHSGLQKLFGRYNDRSKRVMKMPFTISLDEFKRLTSSPCHYCGDQPRRLSSHGMGRTQSSSWGNYYFNGIDRIDSDEGYLPENCVPCCWTCNRAKKDMSHHEFVEWLRRVAAFQS